jgi:hypothetical protein
MFELVVLGNVVVTSDGGSKLAVPETISRLEVRVTATHIVSRVGSGKHGHTGI